LANRDLRALTRVLSAVVITTRLHSGIPTILGIELQVMRRFTVALADQQSKRPIRSRSWRPLFWCFPSLGGLALFLCSFPIDRQIPFWPHLQIAEIFAYWFVFIAPVTTVIATVLLVMRRRRIPRLPKVVGWLAISMSVLANAFVLLGMAG
jgi:hypothetical protein